MWVRLQGPVHSGAHSSVDSCSCKVPFLVVGSACSNTTTTLTIAFGHSSAAVLFRPLGLQRLHAITSMRQRAAIPLLGGSKDELNDHFSRLSDLGTHVVLRANTASKDSLRCIDRGSTNDLWACMFVVRSCYFHSVKFNDCMVC